MKGRLMPFFRIELSADETLELRKQLQTTDWLLTQGALNADEAYVSLQALWAGGILSELLAALDQEAER